MTIHPLRDWVCGAVHVQRESVTIQKLTHVPFSPHPDPVLFGLIVRICVDNVGGRSFLRQCLGESISRNSPVKEAGELRVRSCQIIQL